MPYSQPLWRRSRAKANKAIYAVGRHTVQYTLLCMRCHSPTEWTVMRLLLSSSALGGIRSDGPSSRQFWLTSQFGWLLPRPSSSARMCPLTVGSLRFVLESCCQNPVLCHRNICSLQLFMREKLYFFFPPFCISCCFNFCLPWHCFTASVHWAIWKETLSARDVTSINILILNILLLTH